MSTLEQKSIQPIKLNYEKFRKEYKRLSSMTTFARAMDKAIDIKADKWLDYVPLTQAELFDDVVEGVHITLVAMAVDGQLAHTRSTHRGARFHKQQTVIHRPTEMKAILHAQGLLVIESDFVVIRQEPNKEMRWCIVCKKSHEVADFMPNKRYLNGLSFACRKALDEGRRGTWRHAA